MLTILASFAQEESRSLSENCKWGIRKRFEKGIPNGHFRVYGYRWEGDDQVITTREGCRWVDSNIKVVLTNVTYTGNLLLQKEFISDPISKQRKKNRGSFHSILWRIRIPQLSIRKHSTMCRKKSHGARNWDRGRTRA